MFLDGTFLTFQTIAQQVAAISDIANTIAADASGINKRATLEKVNNLGSTFADTNTKSSLIQSSVNHLNENVDSILQIAQSVNDKTDTVRGTTNQIEQNMESIGSSFDHIAERIGSTSHTTNEIKTQTDSIQSLASETNRKTDMLRSLFDNFARITRQTVQTARCLFG
jgi:methyl-accepting chemotaxis protein